MNLFVITRNNPYSQSSASSNRLLSLIEPMAQFGVQVNLFITDGYGSIGEKTKFGVNGIYNNISYEYLSPILLASYWKVRYHNYVGYYLCMSKVIDELTKRIENMEGIVWTDVSSLGFRFAVASKKHKFSAKIFIEMSEFLDIYQNNKGNFLQRLRGNSIQHFFELKAYLAYDGMALMTNALLQHYQTFVKPQSKLLHLPMTVDLDRFEGSKPKLPEFQSPYIVFVGVMNDAKDGISYLIKAFNSIKNKFYRYKVYLVGGWDYDTPHHLRLIKDLKLTDKIFWMKEYSRDQIPNIICNADLLVLPRPYSKQAQGGFPTKLGEYLASGNPVCATTVGEIPDYLVDNESVFFAEPGSVESFAEAMDRALSDPENAKRVGMNGRKVAEKEFNKVIQAKRLYDFFWELLEEEPTQKGKGPRP